VRPISLLGQARPWSSDADILRITAEDDATKAETQERIVKAIRGAGRKSLLWCSIPCTGGTQWYRYNRHRPGGVEKQQEHTNLCVQLWRSFTNITSATIQTGCSIVIEWPRQCQYWDRPEVRNFLIQNSFVFSDFDGCQYGLESCANGTLGRPIRKPWRLASNTGRMLQGLDRKCQGAGRSVRPDRNPYTPNARVRMHPSRRVTQRSCARSYMPIMPSAFSA